MTWLSTNQTSPITRNRLVAADLRPNRSLQDLIADLSPPPPPATPGSVRGMLSRLMGSRAAAPAVAPAPPTLSSSLDTTNKVLETIYPNFSKTLSVTVAPSASTSSTRTPAHVVLVIDVSGSMGCDAKTSDASESSGLSVLDITKHAAKTVVNLLSDNDLLSIVTFHSSAKKEISCSRMSRANRSAASTLIDSLVPQASTNLWDGLVTGMREIKAATEANPGMLSSVFLLTDGVPNCEPPRGHLPMLKMFQDENPDLNFSVNTFG